MREDILLTIAKGGIIYSPGSAGTLQEIFQDAAQNHYKTVGLSSPMVFLGRKFWGEEIPVYSMLETLMAGGRYQNLLLTLTDEREEAVNAILAFKG
jgi:predicted Rossmann-fold nucleotide-binding protein